jgi:hypothetical protein
MGCEKVFAIVNMKFINIFLCFYWLPLTRVRSLSLRTGLPSLLIFMCILRLQRCCLFLIDHVRIDAALWSGSEGKLLLLSIDLKCDPPLPTLMRALALLRNDHPQISETLESGCISNTMKSTCTKNSQIFTGTFSVIPDG